MAEIKELIAAMHKNNMGKLKLRQGEFELVLEGRTVQTVAAADLPAAPAPAAPAQTGGESEQPQYAGNLVTSPIVGTFYAAPAPDKPAYVKVGDKVKKGDVLFIIESMKLMNEVTSEYEGTVCELLVENAQPVEYGQPILRIE